MKNRIFKIGKFRIAWQLDGYILVRISLIANASFTMPFNQFIELGAGLYALLNNLFNQVLFELTVLAVKVIAFIARQHTGGVIYISPYMLSWRRQVILMVDILLKSLQMLFRLRVA
ncbi:hypothetical protein [Pseudomonas syringae]|uniref:hypothetical protein n=1 Tax=Pseudomonas syringae TaxID=317 RepID=UPI0024E18005|nr:hypothetical protein [Pseudomonas syringae]